MTAIWTIAEPLPDDRMAIVRRRTIFDCCKWDPQTQDISVLCEFPLVLEPGAWETIVPLAERLAAEALVAEHELIDKPELHGRLGLPAAVRRALRKSVGNSPCEGPRVMRFDFHLTTEGWRISEANTDVPGGFIEASGFTQQMAALHPGLRATGDPAGAYAAALARQAPGGTVAMVHATAYTDDRQVMIYLAKRMEAEGLTCRLASPADLRWNDGRAHLVSANFGGPVDLIVRFFPAEWLTNLPASCDAGRFFHGSRTPLSNPATAIVTQSKRFPLTWERLSTPLPTWRALLPDTRAPDQVDWERDESWVLKPALGRVGECVAIRGLIDGKEWRRIRRDARWFPHRWVAQRRFTAVPLPGAAGSFFPQLGVFTIDGRCAGVYGRLAGRPLIDWRARELAVLVADRILAAKGNRIGGEQ